MGRIAELLEYARRPGLLGRLSRGHFGRACLVLVVANLVPVLVVGLLWAIGISPAFDGIFWIPALLASVVYVASVLWLMRAFGFWGVGAASGIDGGDQFEGDFTPGQAFALGWLRWAMQIVMIGVPFVLVAMLWVGVRWWHISPGPEIRAVPDKATDIPVPGDWHETGTTEKRPEWSTHHGSYVRSFDLPDGYTYGDVRAWFSSAPWEETLGRLEEAECSTDIERCTADIAPAPGENLSYSLEVWYNDNSIVEDLPPSLRVKLVYHVPEDGP